MLAVILYRYGNKSAKAKVVGLMLLKFKYVLKFLKWTALSILIGCIGGLLGVAFHYTLHYVTHLRSENSWLIFLLPLGGLLSVGIYKLCKLSEHKGINDIIDSILEKKAVSPLLTPVLFITSAITHLFGGSGGREGAVFQIGGSAASAVATAFRLKPDQRTVLIMSGMSAAFAGLFGTPLTATLFTLEFAAVGTILSPAVFPCYLSSFIAVTVSRFLNVAPETAAIGKLQIGFDNIIHFTALTICISFLGIAVCEIFHKLSHLAKKLFPSQWIRIFVLAIVFILATLAVGDQRYSGSGMDMALKAVGGSANAYDFLLKLLFTALTLCAGFKGGEIVPVFCIGATFGCAMGDLLGLDPGICAALGLVGLFCCVTNAPITSIILSIEMFGADNIHVFAFVCIICFVLSGHYGLYESQMHQFHKVSLSRHYKYRANTDNI